MLTATWKVTLLVGRYAREEERFSKRFDKIDNRFFGGGLLRCLEKIGGIADEYKRLRSNEERSRALLGMLMSIRHGSSA